MDNTLIKLSEDDIKYFTEVGEYFGYPKCCINQFILRMNTFNNGEKLTNPITEHEKLHGIGMVTCEHHSQLLIDNKIKIEDVILNSRKAEQPFPNETDIDYIYIETLKIKYPN